MSSEAVADLALVENAVDSAHVLHDHLADVVKLTLGEFGGASDAEQGWRKKLGFDRLGHRSLARAMGAAYGPEQLHKAGTLADDLEAAIDELGSARSAVAVQAAADAAAVGVHGFAATLRSSTAAPDSPEIGELYRQLGRVMTILGEARTRLMLERMRNQS